MKPILCFILAPVVAAFANPEKSPTVSHLPAKGIGQLIVDRLDITTFRSSLGPRIMAGQRHFADLGMKPVSVTDELVDFSDDEWTFTIRVLERRDQDGDGIEDLRVLLTDLSKISSYAAGASLTLTRQTPDGNLIALVSQPEKNAPAANSPEAVVTALYEAHARGKSPFFQSEDRASLDRSFVRAFADLIWKDAQQPAGEQGTISADPLIDAQDGDPTELSILVAEEPKDGKALITATFHLLGQARRVRFRMEQEDGAWKISDILGHDFASLRESLQAARKPSVPEDR